MGGVPGALSNEPPAAAEAPETLADGAEAADAAATTTADKGNRRSQTTRNYELDRTIAHTRPAVGQVRRLSVAVVVRNPRVEEAAAPAEEGAEAAPTGFDAATLARMENLVKEAIGYDAARGDSVRVTNVDFVEPPLPEPLPEPPLWEQPWVWSVAKQVLGGLFVLFIVFGVIRPTVRSLMSRQQEAAVAAASPDVALLGADGNAAVAADGSPVAGQAALPGGQIAGQQALPAPGQPADVGQLREMVNQDPRVAAQVIKGWVAE